MYAVSRDVMLDLLFAKQITGYVYAPGHEQTALSYERNFISSSV